MLESKTQFNLLIVDDVASNIQVLGKCLQQDAYSFFFAINGQEAFDLAIRNSIDLILLDIMMPGMDGYQVCRLLKTEPRTKDIPVIFITAKTGKEDIVRGFEAGAVDYVTKPFNPAELLARVRTHLELKHARRVIEKQADELAWTNKRLTEKNNKLQQAIDQIETLKGLLPVCSNCKKIRLEQAEGRKPDAWVSLEAYLHEHTAAEVTHTVCPACMAVLYPEMDETKK